VTAPDDGYAAHAAYTESRRADVRENLRGIDAQISAVQADIEALKGIDCGADCCGSTSDRTTALEFLASAQRSVAAAHGLMRHLWREDGA
jgi:hypothetical protein